MAQTVRELMAEPITVPADTSLTEAARIMRDTAIGNVVIADGGNRLRGLVTDRDIVIRGLAEEHSPDDTTVGDICSPDLVTVGPDDDLGQAVEMMRQAAIRRLPVVESGQLVGVLSIGDLAIERDESSALADISAADPNT